MLIVAKPLVAGGASSTTRRCPVTAGRIPRGNGRGRVRVLVVCGVEAATFEYDPAARAWKPANPAAAFGASLNRLVRHVLQHVEVVTTPLTFVTVCRHLGVLNLLYPQLYYTSFSVSGSNAEPQRLPPRKRP